MWLLAIFAAVFLARTSSRTYCPAPSVAASTDSIHGADSIRKALAEARDGAAQTRERLQRVHEKLSKAEADLARTKLHLLIANIVFLVVCGISTCFGAAGIGVAIFLSAVLGIPLWGVSYSLVRDGSATITRHRADATRLQLQERAFAEAIDVNAVALARAETFLASRVRDLERMARDVAARSAPAHAATLQRITRARSTPAPRRVRESATDRAIAAGRRAAVATFIRDALTHWTTVATDLDGYAARHADAILANADRISADYHDSSRLGLTADECQHLATEALRDFPAEVARWLPSERERTVAHLAHIFRRYCGDMYERVLPAARDFARGKPLTRPAAPESGTRLAQFSKAVRDLIGRLPADVAAGTARRLADAMTLADMGRLKQEVLKERREQLVRSGLSPELLEDELRTIEQNLQGIDREWAQERGLTQHAAS